MSLTLEMTLPTLISSALSNNNAKNGYHIPSGPKAFFSLKYPQPPLTLLKYHVSPMKIEKEDLESTLSHGSKIDTLLHGHPLVVSTLEHVQNNASINNVKIKQWDIYNDGHVIVHGVENFFDPAYQTILYPVVIDIFQSGNSGMYGASSYGVYEDIISFIDRYRKLIYIVFGVAILSVAMWCVVELVNRCRTSPVLLSIGPMYWAHLMEGKAKSCVVKPPRRIPLLSRDRPTAKEEHGAPAQHRGPLNVKQGVELNESGEPEVTFGTILPTANTCPIRWNERARTTTPNVTHPPPTYSLGSTSEIQLRVVEKLNGVELLNETKTPNLYAWSEKFCADLAVKDLLPETEKLLEFAKTMIAN
ncbi:hypothetical protein IFM89_030855 [Coptis chinensis]|uniref:Uncharacterized protein n=1 Tax=Coptis chinensis TaxID=261450 RepID=A0A835LF33_9MAGN|nr:hypothetical protein IFM89_030855 [Coptis chinensis]